MCSVEGLREFINDRLSAAAVEIFTVVQQTIVQHREEVDAQRRLQDVSWRGETKTHTAVSSELPEQHVWKEEQLSNREQTTTPQTKEDQDQMVVKQEADTVMVTVMDENIEQRENLLLLPLSPVREFINGRLTAAALEIFTVVEQTIVLHQEEEEDGQPKLPEINWKSKRKLNRRGVSANHQQGVCKEEQLCNQGIYPSLYQEETEPSQIKVELNDPSTIPEEEKLVLKEEAITVLVTSTLDESDQSQPESHVEQLHCGNSDVDENQNHTEAQFLDTASFGNAELQPNSRLHIKHTENSPISENRRQTETTKKCLTCEFCGKNFKCVSQIERHHRIHTGEKPYPCETCGKSFSQKHLLRGHMKTHTGERPHSCVVCGKSFIQHGHLLRHMRGHTGEKPYCCATCGKRFSRQDILLVHMGIHTGEKPYSCETCGKSFKYKISFVTHMRNHTGEKPYSCEICGKSFTQHGTLLRHMRTHTCEKPHSCIICGKSFSLQSNLSSHMRTHTGERPYSCKTCGKSFSQQSNLLRHMGTHKQDMLETEKMSIPLPNSLGLN